MARKTFKDNPALQFLSEPEGIEEDRQTIAPAIPENAPLHGAPEGYKINPFYVETKSRRMQLVLRPSLYESVKACAKASGVSVNEYVHTALEEATKKA